MGGDTAAGGTRNVWTFWLPLRAFLLVGWLRVAVEKMVDPAWWSGEALRVYAARQSELSLPFVPPVVDAVVLPAVQVVAVLVVVLQLVTAAGFLTRRWFPAALCLGSAMNVVFVATGSVNPSAFYLVMQLGLLGAVWEGAVDGRIREPGRTTLWTSAVVAAAGLLMLPFIRTLAPAEIIADPASMLAFLAALAGGSGLLRWVLYHNRARQGLLEAVGRARRVLPVLPRGRVWWTGPRPTEPLTPRVPVVPRAAVDEPAVADLAGSEEPVRP